MEDPKSFSAPVTAFNDDTASIEKVLLSKESTDDHEGKADIGTKDNSTDSKPSGGVEVDTEKLADLEANVRGSSSASESNQKQEKCDETIDSNIVDWDGPDDPSNPMNWPPWKVKTHIFLVSSITFIR